MQCPYCKEEIIDGALVCRFCSKKQPPSARQRKANSAKTRKMLLIGIPCSLVALFLASGVATIMHGNSVEARLRQCAEIAPLGLTGDQLVAQAEATAPNASMSVVDTMEMMGRLACPRLFSD